jgi:2-methylcitrate dehydratase PrpD
VNGAATLDAFRPDALDNPVIRALAKRITVSEDPTLTAQLPSLRPARVLLELTDGRRFESLAQTNRGDSENPYSSDEVVEKFMEIAQPQIGSTRAKELVAAMLTIDQASSLKTVIALGRSS